VGGKKDWKERSKAMQACREMERMKRECVKEHANEDEGSSEGGVPCAAPSEDNFVLDMNNDDNIEDCDDYEGHKKTTKRIKTTKTTKMTKTTKITKTMKTTTARFQAKTTKTTKRMKMTKTTKTTTARFQAKTTKTTKTMKMFITTKTTTARFQAKDHEDDEDDEDDKYGKYDEDDEDEEDEEDVGAFSNEVEGGVPSAPHSTLIKRLHILNQKPIYQRSDTEKDDIDLLIKQLHQMKSRGEIGGTPCGLGRSWTYKKKRLENTELEGWLDKVENLSQNYLHRQCSVTHRSNQCNQTNKRH
jgi:hypothetical protein